MLLLLCGDIFLLYAALYSALAFRYSPTGEWFLFRKHFFSFSVIYAFWIIFLSAFGLYDLRLMKNGKIFLYRLLQAMAAGFMLAVSVFYLFPFGIEPRRNLFIITFLGTFFIVIWRYFFNLVIPRAPSSRVIFFGAGKETRDLADYLLLHPQLGHKPVAFVVNGETENETPSSFPYYTLLQKDFRHIARDTRPDIVVIAREMKTKRDVVKALLAIIPLGISVAEFPAFHEMITGKIPLSLIEEVWFLENLIGIKKHSYEFAKRIIDAALAIVVAIPALFTFPLIALAITLNSPGPVFFRQKRVGRNGAVFTLLKYRSTHRTAVPVGTGRTKEDEDGVYTRVGKLLRRSYIDEIPQIINILKGEMSFVGPRPERPEYVKELKEKIPFYEMRLLVPPGITGWAQINMEDDASVEDAPEKMQYDLYYTKNRSFVLDLLIMLKTLFTLFQREGR
ncbi:MAG: sugar transferase [Parcubacteria group bacterium Gr01-1014_33]|nr:MAG: sugar transferase [Parcubacteria group bacterium Gr01-1014_33]